MAAYLEPQRDEGDNAALLMDDETGGPDYGPPPNDGRPDLSPAAAAAALGAPDGSKGSAAPHEDAAPQRGPACLPCCCHGVSTFVLLCILLTALTAILLG